MQVNAMDIHPWVRETWPMLPPGSHRQRLASTLNAAYAEGVLSENTLVHRLELLFGSPLVDPDSVIGDLGTRRVRSVWATSLDRVKLALKRAAGASSYPALLALDWEGGGEELVIGRHPSCDIVLAGPAVSRRHARLTFRDGAWILQDLGSTNGTIVNSARVGRCKLNTGDRLVIGDEQLLVD
jgi:FHA domain